ncbi:hypothetical protein ACQP1W_29770 [Spirillospora sp. CA-255316]
MVSPSSRRERAHRDITLSFITDYPTPAQAGRIGEARIEGFCRLHGYSGHLAAATLVERIRPHLLSASPGTTAHALQGELPV